MNLKYMMLKDRYIFSYEPHLTLFSPSDEQRRAKEISMYLKELTLYSTSLEVLTKNTASRIIKNELLNIAAICVEEELFYDLIKSNRRLPIKQLSNFTYKSKFFIEKWQYHIIAYFLILSNNNYHRLKSYLSIKNLKINTENNDIVSLQPINESNTNFTGIVFKFSNKVVFVLTAQGDFIKLNTTDLEGISLGSIYTGTLKRELSYYKYPIAVAIFVFILVMSFSFYMYLKPSRTIVIDANATVKIKINAFDKTIDTKPLSVNGSKITNSLKLFNKPMDDSIYLILKEAREKNIANEKTVITIFLTGSKKESPDLIKTSTYISEHNLKVSVNNNGIEHRLEK